MQDEERFRFETIREKHGALRVSWGDRLSVASEQAVREAVDLAEARSLCICELCGAKGRLFRAENIVMTRCVGLREEVLRGLRLPTITVTAADLRAEPRRSNADLVWLHEGRKVPVDLRLGILQTLIDDGPLPLGDLCRRVRADREPNVRK